MRTGIFIVDVFNQFLDDFRKVEVRSVPNDLFRKQSFHDQRALNQYPVARIVSIDAWMNEVAAMPETYRPIYWIFHLAFTGSTFLSRQLGAFSNVIAFREPYPLTQLAMLYRNPQQAIRKQVETKLHTTLKWYANQDSAGSICSIKPHDIVNYFISPALRHGPNSSGILICSNLQTFIVKCLKEPMRREWVRSRLTSCGAELSAAGQSRSLLSLTDAEAAAWIWFGFSLHMMNAANQFPSKITIVSSGTLQTSSQEILDEIGTQLRQNMGLADLGQIDASFSGQHSKSDRAFDSESEAREHSILVDRYRGEIALAERLIDNLSQFADVPQRFLESHGMTYLSLQTV